MGEPAVGQAHTHLARSTSAAILAAAGIAALALVGWGSGVPRLTTMLPGQPAMHPLTAIGVILAALSLWLLRRPESRGRARGFAVACAGLVTGIAAFKLLALRFGIAPDLDQLLFPAQVAATPFPGRMGPHSASTLLCVGASFLTLDVRVRPLARLSEVLLLAGLATCAVALVGYAYSATSIHGIMAFNTACALSGPK